MKKAEQVSTPEPQAWMKSARADCRRRYSALVGIHQNAGQAALLMIQGIPDIIAKHYTASQSAEPPTEKFESRSQEKRLPMMRGNPNPLDPRAVEVTEPVVPSPEQPSHGARAAAEEIASTIAPVDWTFAPEKLLNKVAGIIDRHVPSTQGEGGWQA